MFLLFLILWIIFNGRITWEILLFGIVVSAVCYAITCALFGLNFKKDIALAKKFLHILKLLGILLIEILKANIAVMKIVYGKKKPEPVFSVFKSPLKTTGARVALADCITLTPGTITGQMKDGEFTVHCLDKSLASGLDSSSFVRQLKRIEGKGQKK